MRREQPLRVVGAFWIGFRVWSAFQDGFRVWMPFVALFFPGSTAGVEPGVDSAEATCARRTRGENVDTTDGPWSPIASNSASKP